MKRSEKILKETDTSKGVTWLQKQVIKNTALLEHIINNDLRHLWRWILAIFLLIGGLYALLFKLFFGG